LEPIRSGAGVLILLFGSRHLSHAGRLLSLFWPTNKLSFMDDLLPSKQDLDWRTKPFFSGGGIMVQLVRRVGAGQEGQT